MDKTDKIVSPSHTYVCICNKTNFNGHYCRKFKLPTIYKNNTEIASWYFLNRIDFESCVELTMTFEDYSNLKVVPDYYKS